MIGSCGRTFYFMSWIAVSLILMVMVCKEAYATEQIKIISPGEVVYTDDEQASVCVKGILDEQVVNRLGPEGRIFLFVHPVARDQQKEKKREEQNGKISYYLQEPIQAKHNWRLRAFLGGEREHSARHNDQFELIAVATDKPLDNKKEYDEIPPGLGTESSAKSVTVKRMAVDFQSYGEFSHRNTNLYHEDYDSIAGWWENRLIFRYKHVAIHPLMQRMLFEPYGKFTLAASEKQFPWENHVVYGFGLENRILDRWKRLNSPWLSWLYRLRLYVEYLEIEYTKDEAEDWVPDHDFRYGFDLWKEWNIPPEAEDSYLWGELWANVGWRKTNFFESNYETYSSGALTRLGIKPKNSLEIGENFKINVMPYLMLEASYSGKDYFWENRLNIGGGIRVMSVVHWQCGKEIIMRIFAENLHTADHFRGDPDPDTPDDDFRVGINFSYNLF